MPAVKAVAFALLEAWSFLNPNAHDSLGRAYYVAGMEAVRRCIGGVEGGGRGVADAVDAVDAVDDDVLMATLMLDMYDGISAFTGSKPRQSPHLDGGRALIESRKRLSSNNEISQRILLGVRSQVVARAMETGESVRVMEGRLYESGDGVREKVGSPDFALGRLELELAEVQGAVRALRAGVDTLGPWNSCFDRAWELLARVRELDCRLVDWYDTIPEAWVPVTIWATGGGGISDSIGAAGLYQSHCTVHESVFIANMLNGHACTRIKVQLLLLDCLELIDADQVSFGDDFEASHSIVSMRETAKSIVQDLADAICASIPFHLGDRNEALRIDDTSVQYPRIGISLLPQEHYITAAAHGGIFLITKLTQLLSLGPLLREGQREWILGQMGRIKRIYRAPSVIVGSC